MKGYTHSPSEGLSLEAGPQGFCCQSPVPSRRQLKLTAFAPMCAQTVEVVIYSHPSLGRLDDPTPNGQVVPQLEQHMERVKDRRKNFCQFNAALKVLTYSMVYKFNKKSVWYF